MAGKCPICGETDPAPGSYCLPKIIGDAKPGKPCSWSVEGGARIKTMMEEQYALYERERAERAHLDTARATPSTRTIEIEQPANPGERDG